MSDYLASVVWGGASYRITQPWGVTSLLVEPYWKQAQSHWHCGVDIGMNVGTPLFAARTGKVSGVSWGCLIIQVGAEADCYIHIDRSVVSPGWLVKAGQLVAYSGAKIPAGGSLTGPHLHFEVQTGALNNPATSEDPIPVLTHTFTFGSGSLGDENETMLFYKEQEHGYLFVAGEAGKRYVWGFEAVDWQAKLGEPQVRSATQLAQIPDVLKATAPGTESEAAEPTKLTITLSGSGTLS